MKSLQGRLPEHIVFDSDLLLGKWTDKWDAHFELVLTTVSGIADNDRHVVVSGSLMAERLDPLPSRDRLGEIFYINLDCSDDERARRLGARPRWRNWNLQRLDEANAFAARLRRAGDLVVDTTDRSVEEIADAVAEAITAQSRPFTERALRKPGAANRRSRGLTARRQRVVAGAYGWVVCAVAIAGLSATVVEPRSSKGSAIDG